MQPAPLEQDARRPTAFPAAAAGETTAPEPPPAPAPPPAPEPQTQRQAEPPPPPSPPGKEQPDFTDADLKAALQPLLQAAPGPAPDHDKLIAMLEPLVRVTVRRALAEARSPHQRPFRKPGLWDCFRWRMKALLSSRSYDEVLFQKTQRFQVDEAFLFDSKSLALISYASSDPARHANPNRVRETAMHIAGETHDPEGGVFGSFWLPEERLGLVVPGVRSLLVAVVRGIPCDIFLSDLAYCLARIEERFGERLQQPGSPPLREIQPFLEDCLLIQAPGSC